MPLLRIDHNPSPKHLAWFGALMGIFLAVVGASLYRRLNLPLLAMAAWVLAVVVPAIYYLVPTVRKPLYVGWMYAVYPIGFVISYAVLALMFYGVFTPVGFMLRCCGRDLLHRSWDRDVATYWVPHRTATNDQRYFNQF